MDMGFETGDTIKTTVYKESYYPKKEGLFYDEIESISKIKKFAKIHNSFVKSFYYTVTIYLKKIPELLIVGEKHDDNEEWDFYLWTPMGSEKVIVEIIYCRKMLIERK